MIFGSGTGGSPTQGQAGLDAPTQPGAGHVLRVARILKRLLRAVDALHNTALELEAQTDDMGGTHSEELIKVPFGANGTRGGGL